MEKPQNYYSALASLDDNEDEDQRSSQKDAGASQGSGAAKSSGNGKKKKTGGGRRKEEEVSADVKVGRVRMPLVWIDLVMSGLDIEKDRILEIACVVTDGRLERTFEGPDIIVSQPEEILEGMDVSFREHHAASGLMDGVRASSVTEEEAEQEVLKFVRKYTRGNSGQPLLAGNSVYVDLRFLNKYMPTLAAEFSHVLVDVSSIRALCVRWYPREAEKQPAKQLQHRSLADIKESIAELKYLRRNIFKQPQK
ncbi:oligoribonuclease [Physcomitrium patens]|uniref:Exonuclease domain-containing protein n=1 Tax=Physcomitrium patens TaxID=3218 RepID=A0A2K1K2X9_PHYPA|nr:oligoribonuclease-like [Physcomitrium patens]PNR48133.1 hypothetical protein PHYPA_012606 [Physcomitrium patens]|eukprot:XP_024385302.1 oligoribonuclease-like [Physcomitrella patens]